MSEKKTVGGRSTDELEFESTRSERSRSTDSSKRSGGSSSLLNLMQLRSAQKKVAQDELTRKIEQGKVLWEKENIGFLAKKLANRIFEELGRVPAEVESIAIDHYGSVENPRWSELVIQDFEQKELSFLIKTFTGMKKLSVDAACKLLSRISNTGETNPAYVLQVYELWDKALGDQVALPTDLLDRTMWLTKSSPTEEAKLAVLVFVAGVVVHLLLKVDEIKYEAYYNYGKVEDDADHVDIRKEAYDRLGALMTESAQKGQRTPMVPVRQKGKRNKESTKDFTAPRTLGTAPLKAEIMKSKERVATTNNAMLEDLQASVKELVIALKTTQAAVAEKEAKIDELTQKLGAAQGFAKAAMTNESHALKGKSLKKKNNFVDEESEEQLSATESLSSSSSEASEKKSKRTVSTVLTSGKRDSLVEQHANTVQISASRRPVDVTFLLDQIDTIKGLLWADVRGNLYAIRKVKSKDSCAGPYKLALLHANWQDESTLQYDVNSNSKYFLAQNFLQWRAFMNLQLSTLEKDMQNEVAVRDAKNIGGYDTSVRKDCVNSYYLLMKDLIQSILPGECGSDHPLHVQAWAIFAHFNYLIFTYAMLTNNDEMLRSNALSLWNLHFDAKIKAIAFSISFKDAASLLGYGCSKSGCRKVGVLDNYCPGCNREAVGTLLGRKGTSDDSNGESFSVRYSKWKAAQEANGVTAANLKSKEAFKKANPAPKRDKVGVTMISEEEYYSYMGANQHLFVIQKPSRIYLNF